MEKEGYSWGGIGFLALFFLIVVTFWNRGGNGWGFGNYCGGFLGDGIGFGASSYGFQNYRATCDAEKREIINTATTQYQVEQQAAATRELVQATANATQTKIDFYAYQGLRDAVAERDRQIMELKNMLFVKDQLAPVNAQLASISCNMLRRPDVTGVGVACPSAAILNGLGINSLNNGCGYGCNGNNVLV